MSDLQRLLAPELVAAFERFVDDRVASTLGDREQPGSEFVTPNEAATLLRCDRQRIYDLASAGRLPRFKENGRTLHRRDDVLALRRNSSLTYSVASTASSPR